MVFHRAFPFVLIFLSFLADSGTRAQAQNAIPRSDESTDTGPAIVPTAPSPQTPAVPSGETPLTSKWRNGVRFESADKAYSLTIGGRMQLDTVGYITTEALRNSLPGSVPLEPGFSIRRLRFDMAGTLEKNIEYYAQIDFVNGYQPAAGSNRLTNAAYPTDLWITFKELPGIGNLRVGNQKPPYSFEHLTSSRFLNFLERSPGFDAFAEGSNNGFQPGITVSDNYADKHGLWSIGLFKMTRSPLAWNVGRDETELSGRLTYLPVYECEGRQLLHLGLGGAARELDQEQARFRARLGARNSPSAFANLIADTGVFDGNHQFMLNPEIVAVNGPWSFQSEAYASWIPGATAINANGMRLPNSNQAFFWSCYAEVHYFLTGEHREYQRETGAFTRVVPRTPFQWNRGGILGGGAWQLAARYAYLDLDSGPISGGRMHEGTIGLNWFMTPMMKAQFNYSLSVRDGSAVEGLIHAFAIRMALDW